jgi:hypothetical protein
MKSGVLYPRASSLPPSESLDHFNQIGTVEKRHALLLPDCLSGSTQLFVVGNAQRCVAPIRAEIGFHMRHIKSGDVTRL